jgi:hypothetical protein
VRHVRKPSLPSFELDGVKNGDEGFMANGKKIGKNNPINYLQELC